MPQHVRRWPAFAVLAVAYFMTIIDLTITNVALPTIGQALRFTESDLQWVVTAYGLTFGGLLLLGGRAADLLGRRRIFLAGIATFTVASLACGLATDDWFLVIARGVQGAGAALLLPAALGIVMTIFPEGAERNRALGAWGGIGAMGATVGLIAGGLLTTYIGWEAIFYANVPIGVAALVLAPRLVPESRREVARRHFDPAGAIAVTGGLLILVYAISTAPAQGWSSARTVLLLVVAALALAAFVVIETRVPDPLLPMRVVRSRTVAASNAVGLLLCAGFYSFLFVGTLYMQQVLGFSALETGLAFLAASLTSIALAALSQRLVTRVGPGPVMVAGMTAIAGGIAWATGITVDGGFWSDLAGPLIVMGAGTAFAFIPVSIGALTGVRNDDSGIASGLLSTSQQLGGALGVAIVSTVATSHATTVAASGVLPALAMTEGFRWAIWVSAAIGAVGVPIGLVVSRRREPAGLDSAERDSGGMAAAVPAGGAG